MALYKNDEPHKLTKEQIQSVYDFMGWNRGKERPAVIKFPDAMYVFNKDNNRNIRPPHVNIPLEMTVFVDGEGSTKWNYTEAPPREEDKRLIYPRKSRPFTGTFSVGIEKIDLLWFLIHSKFRANMPDEPNRIPASKPLYKIEMKEKEAKEKLQVDRLQTRIKAYINGPEDMSWPTAKVMKYAIAFGIEDAEEMGEFELRSTLLGRIQGERGGYSRFESLANSEGDATITFLIKKAVSEKLIRFSTKKRMWVYLSPDGKEGTEICPTRHRLSFEESLLETMKEDNIIYQSILNLVEEKKEEEDLDDK